MNPNHIKLAVKALASFVVADQLIAGFRNKKRCNHNAAVAQALTEENEQMRAEAKATLERTRYLLEMLDEHGVPVTEFDLIVINSPTQ